MKKSLIVARWEFLSTITRRAYLFAVVAMPLLIIVLGTIGGFAGRVTASTAGRLPIAIVDRASVVDVTFADATLAAAQDDAPPDTPLERYGDLDRAIAALSDRRVAAVFLVDADYLSTGALTEYSHDSGFFAQQTERQRQNRVSGAIRASLMKPTMNGDALKRAYAPVGDVKHLVMDSRGAMHETDDASGVGAFGVFYVLLMSIFFSAGFLQQATVEDRQSRTLEILLSSLDSDELLLGKLLGLGAAGLLQVAIYLLFIIVPGATVIAIFKISIGTVLLSLVYYAIAYFLFAGLMTGTGVLGRTAQESAQFSALWTFAAASPLFFSRAIGSAPNGVVARAMSYFPLSSPTTMMLRLTSADVPTTDIVATIVLGIVSIYVVLRAASKIFRAASLMYGKRPTLPELVKWLKAAG